MKEYSDWFVHLLEFLLPRRYWYRNFYLRSYHWRLVRKNKLRQSMYLCSKCKISFKPGSLILDVHHLTYKNMWHERMEDLDVLCRGHHIEEHKHG